MSLYSVIHIPTEQKTHFQQNIFNGWWHGCNIAPGPDSWRNEEMRPSIPPIPNYTLQLNSYLSSTVHTVPSDLQLTHSSVFHIPTVFYSLNPMVIAFRYQQMWSELFWNSFRLLFIGGASQHSPATSDSPVDGMNNIFRFSKTGTLHLIRQTFRSAMLNKI